MKPVAPGLALAVTAVEDGLTLQENAEAVVLTSEEQQGKHKPTFSRGWKDRQTTNTKQHTCGPWLSNERPV